MITLDPKVLYRRLDMMTGKVFGQSSAMLANPNGPCLYRIDLLFWLCLLPLPACWQLPELLRRTTEVLVFLSSAFLPPALYAGDRCRRRWGGFGGCADGSQLSRRSHEHHSSVSSTSCCHAGFLSSTAWCYSDPYGTS